MKILIIEDEPPAQLKLEGILQKIEAEAEVLACLDSVSDSVAWLSNNQADLIFMDIQLADGSAFEIFKEVQVNIPIIFTTAYSEYAVQAFKVNSIDYLLKPIEEKDVNAALIKYKRVTINPMPVNFSAKLIAEFTRQITIPPFKSRFMVTIGDRIKYLSINEIAYFKSDGNIVFLISKDSSRFIINYSLDQLHSLVDPALFFRLNRSFFVNIGSIKDVRKHFNSRLKVYLSPSTDDDVFVSRIKVPDFLKWMDI